VIDTHAHVAATWEGAEYTGGTEGVLARAAAAGVEHVICVGAGGDAAEMAAAVACAQTYAGVSAITGIHPHDAKNVDAALWQIVTDTCALPEVVAVGETGLDFHYDSSPRDVQEAIFRAHIRLARHLQKPLCIHTRDAEDLTLRVLQEERASEVGGVIHCFSGTCAFGLQMLDYGFYLSIPGIVTFKKAGEIVETVRRAPLDRLLVETDSPFLAPIPYRGKRNEPAYVVETLKKIAEIKELSVAEVERATNENALRLFGPRLQAKLAGTP
jgi:TatD DNase family protein